MVLADGFILQQMRCSLRQDRFLSGGSTRSLGQITQPDIALGHCSGYSGQVQYFHLRVQYDGMRKFFGVGLKGGFKNGRHGGIVCAGHCRDSCLLTGGSF